jgi:hypothetical protein
MNFKAEIQKNRWQKNSLFLNFKCLAFK